MEITNHANERMQQRGIYPIMVDLLKEFGSVQFHKGRQVLSIDKDFRKALKKYCGPEIASELLSGHPTYIVIEDGTLVTTARKFRRHKKDRNNH